MQNAISRIHNRIKRRIYLISLLFIISNCVIGFYYFNSSDYSSELSKTFSKINEFKTINIVIGDDSPNNEEKVIDIFLNSSSSLENHQQTEELELFTKIDRTTTSSSSIITTNSSSSSSSSNSEKIIEILDSSQFEELEVEEFNDNQTITCQTPEADPWHPEISEVISYPRTLSCQGKQPPDFSYVDDDGYLNLNFTSINSYYHKKTSKKVNTTIDCRYSYFDRGSSDRQIIFEKERSILNSSSTMVKFKMTQNFVRIICYEITLITIIKKTEKINNNNSNNSTSKLSKKYDFKSKIIQKEKIIYMNLHAHPVNLEQKNSTNNINKLNNNNLYNIYIIGFESLSFSMSRRHLSDTYNYLKNQMNATMFPQFQKVGENTLPNLGALFTGRRVYNEQENMPSELPTINRTNNWQYDEWPFIWREFSNQGYACSYLEDDAAIGTFHYGAYGFKKKPLEYWYFPYWEAVGRQQSNRSSYKFCFENQRTHDVYLDILRRHVMVKKNKSENQNPNRPQFLFSIFSALSHDYTSDVGRCDTAFAEFFRRSHSRGDFDRSILIIVSDHGPRFTKQRPFPTGFLEERQPFLAVWLPPNFDENLRKNLEVNSKKLVTMFDLHETLRHILRLGTKNNQSINNNNNNDRSNKSIDHTHQNRFSKSNQTIGRNRSFSRGYSLFSKKIPSDRTCTDASIPDRYCLCNGARSLLKEMPNLANRSAELILEVVREKSAENRNICVVFEIERIRYFLEFPMPFLLQKNWPNYDRSYYVAFSTGPLPAIFEGVVLYNSTDNRLIADKTTLERLTYYGAHSGCVKTGKKFCACKKYL